MDRYAVFGNPIQHSKSPQIHSIFARQTEQVMEYRARRVPLKGFAAAAREFFDAGGQGLNITVPFKVDAFEFADQRTDRARRAGAVNTLVRQEGGVLLGDNTDGIGLVRDLLDNHRWELAGRRLLILGAGGAVRGILEPLLEQRPDLLVIEIGRASCRERVCNVVGTVYA